MSQKFIKKLENFICEHCNFKVKGDGYTNHCPHCLWSKHVDVNPGDRAEECGGMMKPVGFQKISGKERIVHKCLKCGFEKVNKVKKDDNIDAILKI